MFMRHTQHIAAVRSMYLFIRHTQHNEQKALSSRVKVRRLKDGPHERVKDRARQSADRSEKNQGNLRGRGGRRRQASMGTTGWRQPKYPAQKHKTFRTLVIRRNEDERGWGRAEPGTGNGRGAVDGDDDDDDNRRCSAVCTVVRCPWMQ